MQHEKAHDYGLVGTRYPSEPILDQAHMLTSDQKDALTKKVNDFGQKTGMYIKLVTVDDVSPYGTVSDYTKDLYHNWELGDPVKHNGLMLVIGRKIGSSSHDMKDYCRIMTGWGTMKMLPDDFIITTVKHGLMMPHLPDDPYTAFDGSLDALFQKITEWNTANPDNDVINHFATTDPSTSSSLGTFWNSYKWYIIVVLVVICIVIFFISISGSDDNEHHYTDSHSDSTSDSRKRSSYLSSSSYSGSNNTNVVIFSCTRGSSDSGGGGSSSCSGGSSCGGGGGCGGGGCGG
jgi:uncharacterized membrane protein YgcG